MAGIGVDIVEYEQVRRARFLDRVAEFAFSANERKQMSESSDAVQFFASRFAAKEAVVKAFPEELSYQDFEIIKEGAKPAVHFLKHAKHTCRTAVSISHSQHFAIGFAIAYEQ